MREIFRGILSLGERAVHQFKPPAIMRNRRPTEIIAVLAGSAALAIIFLSSYELPPRIDRKLHAAIGKALAHEALSLLRPGGRIKVITRDTEAFPQPAIDILMESFKREVRRAGGTTVATQSIQTDPLRRVEMPAGDFFELLRRSSAEQVIVSLLGPPLLTEEQRNKLGSVKPKIVAFCSGGLAEDIDLRQLFNAGLLHAGVVSRRVSAPTGDKAPKALHTFDQLYRIVNVSNFSDSPSAVAQGSGDR